MLGLLILGVIAGVWFVSHCVGIYYDDKEHGGWDE